MATAYWKDDITPNEARAKLVSALKQLAADKEVLLKKKQLCQTFEFPQLVKSAIEVTKNLTNIFLL